MKQSIKNPVPFADGNRASELVQVRNTGKQDNTSNTKIRQRLVQNAVVIETGKEGLFMILKPGDECLGTPPNYGSAA
jgi:hypothetical protein